METALQERCGTKQRAEAILSSVGGVDALTRDPEGCDSGRALELLVMNEAEDAAPVVRPRAATDALETGAGTRRAVSKLRYVLRYLGEIESSDADKERCLLRSVARECRRLESTFHRNGLSFSGEGSAALAETADVAHVEVDVAHAQARQLGDPHAGGV